MRRQIVAFGTVIGILASALPLVPILAASGDLDPIFGTGGKVSTDFGPDNEYAAAVAIQTDGKIIAAGIGGNAFSLARYDTLGVPDPGFDGDGKVTTDFGGSSVANALAIQADGKIVAAGGRIGTADDGFVLARYNTNGSLDGTFDGDGKVTTAFGSNAFSAAGAVAIQPDGKIIAAGLQADSSGNAFALVRYNTNGSLDATFGSGGKVTTNHGGLAGASGDFGVNDLVLQLDGRIVAAGMGGPANDFVLARYDTEGDLDPNFGGDGLVATEFGGYDEANALAIQADGKIVAAGVGAGRFALARYATDGSLDAGFDGDGKVRTQFFGEDEESAHGMAIQTDGKIVVVGRVKHNGDSSYAVARFESDGWLDGKATTGFGDPADVGVLCAAGREDCSEDVANGVVIQSDGKIVAAGGGGVCGNPCDWTLARYTSLAPIRELSAAPLAVDFGAVNAGGTPATATVSITNTGSVASTIDVVELASGAPASITIASQGCPLGSLLPRASCDIGVRFAPKSVGPENTELRIHSDATVGLLAVPLSGVGSPPPSGISWGTIRKAGPAYTFNSGGALARTVKSGSQRLHVAYTTVRIGSSWAKNAGPHMGVYYVRSTSGATWTTPKRLNPSTQHGSRVGAAAYGSRVYVSWVSQTRVTSYRPTARRVLYVRVNTNHGASTSWRSTVRLTSTTGRVDFPTIAASGTDVYIAFTDSVTGSVRLATSHDKGVTWTKRTIGSTTASSSEGRGGFPSVAVSGPNVVVSWNANLSGTVAVRRSTNRGATWSSTQVLTAEAAGAVTTAARGSRLAVTWTTGPEIHARVFTAGSWGPDRLVGAIGPDAQLAYSPTVALQGTARLAVSWSEQITGEGDYSRLRWSESPDGGALWFASQVLGEYTTTTARRSNDWPSVVWASESTRHVLWNGWRAGTNNFRLYLRTGSGLAIGPTSAFSASGTAGPQAIPLDRGDARR